MRSFQALLLIFTLAVFPPCQGVPMSQFFEVKGATGTMDDSQGVSNIATTCGDITTLNVFLEGKTSLVTDSAQQINFFPFLVNASDLGSPGDSDTYQLQTNILMQDANTQDASDLNALYEEYYPREAITAPLSISRTMIITWSLTTGSGTAMEINVFQMVAGFSDTNNMIFVLYQYQDGMMQWSSTNSKVSMQICEDSWTYTFTAGSIHNNIVTNSNVNVDGRYAFLYQDGKIMPAVICKEGCSIENGFCTVADKCDCLPGWMGDICTELACHEACVNGACLNEANVCLCNPGWSGENCTIPDCNDTLCVNGACEEPNMCICDEGWTEMICDQPICTEEECSTNGDCVMPGVCECHTGWLGNDCTTPTCDPMCVNGACEDLNTCTCDTLWSGEICDEPICSEAECSENGMCVMPGVCECPEGVWSGVDCRIPVCQNECVNGQCESPNVCNCLIGWLGEICDEADCFAECINGNCETPNNCTCNDGWMGVNCTQPICLEGCENGFCELPGHCNCTDGYIGELCDSTPATPVFDQTEIGLLAGGLIVFVIIVAIVVAAVILSIRLC